VKAKEFKMWRCSECNQVFTGKADADECCSSCVEAWQIRSSLDGAKVFVNEVDNELVHCFELPLGCKFSQKIEAFVKEYPTLVKG
jgi:hypothetical protein